MKIMRWIDHWLGLPMCFSCSMLIAIKGIILKPKKKVYSGKGPIAFFKFFGLGSIIQATPLIQSIKGQFPNSPIIMVTFPENKLLCERLELFSEVLVIRKNFLLFILDVFKITVAFWLKKVEVIIDLEFFSKFSTLLSLLSASPIRIGFHLNDFWRNKIITHPIYFNYFKHITAIYQQAGVILGITDYCNSLKAIKVTPNEKKLCAEKLCQYGWNPTARTVAMNINAGELSLERRWALDNWSSLIEHFLSSNEERRVILTGSPREHGYIEELINHLPTEIRSKTINIAGLWSIPEFATGLSLCDCFITNDSGPMHLAATVNVPIIALWGPGRPDFYAPKVRHIINIYSEYPCSPCLYMFTSFEGMWCLHRGDCMQQIKTEEIIQKLDLLLRNQQGKDEKVHLS
jgi:ADP-heptose:LPS heptosyltransferase